MSQNTDCAICRHIERKLIENAISEGRPASFFKENFSADEQSVLWHRENCMSWGPDPDPETGRQERFAAIRRMRDRVSRVADQEANDPKGHRNLLSAASTIARLTLLEDKLQDKTRRKEQPLKDTRQWQQLKLRILKALEPFPEARRALVEALERD